MARWTNRFKTCIAKEEKKWSHLGRKTNKTGERYVYNLIVDDQWTAGKEEGRDRGEKEKQWWLRKYEVDVKTRTQRRIKKKKTKQWP